MSQSYSRRAEGRSLRAPLIGIAAVTLLTTLGAVRASANAITVFEVTGTFQNGAAFLPGSTLTMDITLGVATDADLMISAGGNSPAETITGIPNIHNGYPPYSDSLTWQLADGWVLTIYPPTPPSPPPDPSNPAAPGFQGFTGGTLGSVDYFDPSVPEYSGGLTANGLQLNAEVPEPSGVWLLGIGLLGLGIHLRKNSPAN